MLRKEWKVYILKCSDGTLYTGSTNNLNNRIAAHSSGKGAKYTRGRLPVTLLISFDCDDRPSALKLEYRIKQLSKKIKLKLCEVETDYVNIGSND